MHSLDNINEGFPTEIVQNKSTVKENAMREKERAKERERQGVLIKFLITKTIPQQTINNKQ